MSDTREQILEQIKEQGELVRQLKASKESKEKVSTKYILNAFIYMQFIYLYIYIYVCMHGNKSIFSVHIHIHIVKPFVRTYICKYVCVFECAALAMLF